MNLTRKKCVVVGCGYVGKRLLQSLPSGTEGLGVSRNQPEGFDRYLSLDLDTDDLQPLADVSHGAGLFYFAAPSTSSLLDDRSRRLLAALEAFYVKPSAVVLISTTGVYGDCGGQWVDEQSPLKPVAERSLRRADAESAWTDFAQQADVPLAILRVAGIYGPSRLPLARLKKPQPLLREDQSPFSNRVHVDDLIATAMASVGQQSVINVADGSPSTMTGYFHALADAAGSPRLPEAEREVLSAQWSAGLSSYMNESRKIDNTKMRELLGGSLQYPDLALGLASCLNVDPQ